MKPNALCNIEAMPEGKTVADINPAFAGLKGEVRAGKMNSRCASCRKPFNDVRKPRKEIKLYPVDLAVPIVLAYHICDGCVSIYQQGGDSRDSIVAAIESFVFGENPTK